MKIKDYKCKCGSNDFFMSSLKGKPTGIYCSRCGKWLKWADKDERNLELRRTNKITLEQAVAISAMMYAFNVHGITHLVDATYRYLGVKMDFCEAYNICSELVEREAAKTNETS